MTHPQKASVHFYSVVCIVIFFVIFQVSCSCHDHVFFSAKELTWFLIIFPLSTPTKQSYFWYPISVLFNSIRRRFTVEGQGKAVNIPYRKVFGISAYVPLLHVIDSGNNNENWVACDTKDVPRELIPIQHGLDVDEHNLCSRREFPQLSEAELRLRFR